MNNPSLKRDAEYYLQLQTQTGWGRTLESFARWCNPEPGWYTLDVGCGPGLLPALFSKMGCVAMGIDLDPGMFQPAPLHPRVAIGDVQNLPCRPGAFNLVTCSNLLFMLDDPDQALVEMGRILKSGGKIALLNPSELLNVKAAEEFAQARQMEGLSRSTFLNWAGRAEQHRRWSEDETAELFGKAGLTYGDSNLKIGPGFGRFSWGFK